MSKSAKAAGSVHQAMSGVASLESQRGYWAKLPLPKSDKGKIKKLPSNKLYTNSLLPCEYAPCKNNQHISSARFPLEPKRGNQQYSSS